MSGSVDAINGLDRMIHEPARMLIMALLSGADEADFIYLLNESKLSKGNLSSHLSKLEEAGYVEISKGYRGKIPQTLCRLSATGRNAFRDYRNALRKLAGKL